MSKTFTFAGTSVLNGNTKVRFGNSKQRTLTLEKHEHDNVLLIELPEAMSKADAVKFLFAHELFQDELAQGAIATYVVNNAKELATELGFVEAKQPKAEAAAEEVEEPAAEAEDDAEAAQREKRNARRRELRAMKKQQEQQIEQFEG